MAKEIKDARICILTCPFEPPKLKTSTDFVVKNVEDYNRVAALEQSYFVDMVKRVKVRDKKEKERSRNTNAFCLQGHGSESGDLSVGV